MHFGSTSLGDGLLIFLSRWGLVWLGSSFLSLMRLPLLIPGLFSWHPVLMSLAVSSEPGQLLGVGGSTALGVVFSSVAQSHPTLCDPMNCSTPGLPVHHQLPQFIMRNVGLKKHKLESRLPGEISITSDMQMTPPLWQKVKN